MKKEFNLSEKIYDENYCPDSSTHWMKAKDVKEFIKRLKEELCICEECDRMRIVINKFAGEELK